MGYKHGQVRSLTRDCGPHQAWPVKKSAGPGRLNETNPTRSTPETYYSRAPGRSLEPAPDGQLGAPGCTVSDIG